MTPFIKEATHKEPLFEGNVETGKIRIAGKCIPEDTVKAFEPFLTWFDGFLAEPPNQITVTYDLEYFNTSASKVFLEMMMNLRKLSESRPVEIIWVYEEGDYDMEETGHDYKNLVGDIMRIEEKEAPDFLN